jgi:penicillin G amidase
MATTGRQLLGCSYKLSFFFRPAHIHMQEPALRPLVKVRVMTLRALAVLAVFVLLVSSIAMAHQPSLLGQEVDVGSHGVTLQASSGEQVRIVRTAEGVPHVFAESPFGLGFGNGYAQAEDQWFQLHVLRLVSKGEAASVLGPGFLADDLEVRRELYTPEERLQAYEQLPDTERALFEGYAAGVNRVREGFILDPSRMPVEFGAVADIPAPWQVTDTVAVAQFLLDQFGSAGGAALSNAQLLAQLREVLGEDEGWDAFEDVVWLEHPLTTTSIPASEGVYDYPVFTSGWDNIPAEQREVALAAADAVPFGEQESLASSLQENFPFKFGSNAVIIAPHRSTSGGGLLGGGPQMGYFSPMVPYEVGLHGAGFDVAGIGVAGAPGVVIGRTETFSWTVTSGIADQVDIVGVRLVEGDPRRYHFDGEVHQMDCRTELHVVRAPPPTSEAAAFELLENEVITQEVCRTVHGPVFAINEEAGWAFARERSHRYEEINSGLRWLSLGTSTDLEEFEDALSDFAFTFNFHYVDEENMAYFHTGYHPVRHGDLDPRLPRPGTGDYEWQDMLKGLDLPHTVNPPEGWIVNWNNQPQEGWLGGGDQRELFGSVHRVDLLRDLMQAAFDDSSDGKVDLETVAQVVKEAGTRDAFARHIAPFAVQVAQGDSESLIQEMGSAIADWAATDYSWDLEDGTHHPGQTIYERFRTHLQDLVFLDELGPHTRDMRWDPPTSEDPHGGDYAQHRTKDALLLDVLEGRTSHDWCNDLGTGVEESCDDVIRAALEATAVELTQEFETEDVSQWRMPARMIRFVSISAGPAWEIPLQNRASYNHLHDWGVLENRDAASVIPPGNQAGYYNLERFVDMMAFDAFHPHVHNQLDLYVAWEYKPLRFFEDDVTNGAYRDYVLEVEPAVLPL